MSRGTTQSTLGILVAGGLVTVLSLVILSGLRMDGDVYSLLGHDDPVVRQFDALAEVTPGLEELLVICGPDELLNRDTIGNIVAIDGVREHTRTFFQPGKSTVQGFALSVDPGDWHETRGLILEVRGMLGGQDLTCGLTGSPAVIHDMQFRLNSDLMIALAIATLLVSLLFAFVYRIGFLALLMLVPVIAGIAWGLAAYALLRGELTMLAATVPTLLIGIGIDHCIHMIQSCRYSIATDGLSREDAVLLAWKRLFPPITLASLTTAITFVALTMASLRGLADLGWSGALVTLGVYAACVSLLPAILLVSPTSWLTRSAMFDRASGRLVELVRKHGIWFSLAILLSVVGSLYGISRLESLDDNRLLESGELDSIRLQYLIADELGLSSSPILLSFDNPEDGIELLAEVDRPEQIGSLLSVEGVEGVVQVHPRDNPFVRRNYQAMIEVLDSWVPGVGLGDFEVSGTPVMNERLNELVYRDVRIVFPVALLGVFLVLALGTRSFLGPCLVLLPLMLALMWLLGWMGVAGIAASVVTVAIAPLVFGIGVDGGVHLLASWRRHRGALDKVFAETGLAIVVTVLTSMTAFAAFLVSQSPSLVYFGSQAAVALAGSLVVTLVVLPVLFRILLPQRAASREDKHVE
jgi:predicted RND superfamily exporter protein